MKKNKIFTKEEKKQWIKKLSPYWKEYLRVESEHYKKISKLEKKMNDEVKPFKKLSFFYVDGECVGIGAENYSDRENFPLIHDSEF